MAYNLEDGTPSFVIEVDFLKGEKGDTGFSPRIEIASLTSAEYILKVINEDGEFLTPNLKSDLSLEDYVLKEEGKGLSTNSFENEEKQKLQELHNYDDSELRNNISEIQEQIASLGKTYTGTNIIAPTVTGYGRLKKLYGNTVEEGTGDKSPDNPYELKCVGDDVNLFDETQLDYSIAVGTDKYINLTLEPNTEYTLSTTLPLASTNVAEAFLISGHSTSATTNDNGAWNGRPRTITSDSNGYLTIAYRKLNQSTWNLKDYVFKLQKGSVATAYTPYGCGNIENISKGKTIASNVSMTPGMLSSSTGQLNTSYIAYASANEFVAVEENTSYRIDNDQNKKVECVFFYDKNKSYLGYVVANKRNYFVTSTNAKYIKFRYLNTSDITDINSYITGVTVVEASSNVVVAKPLCSIGDVRDELDYTNKKITRRCSSYVLDGSITPYYIEKYDGYTRFDFDFTGRINPILSTSKLISDKMKISSVGGLGNTTEYIGFSNSNSYKIYLYVKNTRLATIDNAGIGSYLEGNPIKIIYATNPYEKDIDCSDKIVQYPDNTTVYNRDGAEIEVELTNNETVSGLNEVDKVLEDKIANQEAMNTYSTEEQVVGTWIDGKPLYRKVIQSTIPSTISSTGTGFEIPLVQSNNINKIWLDIGNSFIHHDKAMTSANTTVVVDVPLIYLTNLTGSYFRTNMQCRYNNGIYNYFTYINTNYSEMASRTIFFTVYYTKD